MSGCKFESLPTELVVSVLDFVPVLDYYNLKLAGSRYINGVVRLVTSKLSREEYCQQISKEYGARLGPLYQGRTPSALQILMERNQEALVRHYYLKYQDADFPKFDRWEPEPQLTEKVFRAALHWATYYGSVSIARILLDKKYTRSYDLGNTPFHIAAIHGRTEVMELLIANGASLDVLNFDGKTPLQFALEYNQEAVVTLLRSKGAAASLDEVYLKYKDDWIILLGGIVVKAAEYPPMKDIVRTSIPGKSNVHDDPIESAIRDLFRSFANYQSAKTCRLSLAEINSRAKSLVRLTISHDHPTFLTSVLDDGFDMLTTFDFCKFTALHCAVQSHRGSIVKLLLEREGDKTALLNAQSMTQPTPLHLAARCGTIEAVRLLLDHGADPTSQDELGNSPLHVSAESEIVRLLLEHGVDVNAKDMKGRTPVHNLVIRCSAAEFLSSDDDSDDDSDDEEDSPSNNEKICDLLRNWGADFSAKDGMNSSPLHLAVEHKPRMIKKLLSFSANVNIVDCNGFSPLTLAIKEKKGYLICRRLLNHGANANATSRCWSRYSPLCVAMKMNAFGLYQDLVDHGADIHWRDKDGRNLLHHAFFRESPPFPVLLPETETETLLKNIDLLAKLGVDVNGKDDRGTTVLFLAASKGMSPAVSSLIKHGAKVNVTDPDGYTPLHYIVRDQCGPTVEIINALVNNGADVNARARDGSMPLHIATRRDRNHHMVKVLLDCGADVNARDGKGRTPLHGIVLQKIPYFGDVLKVLVNHGARVDEHDEDGQTPIDIEMKRKRNREEYLDILLQKPKAQS